MPASRYVPVSPQWLTLRDRAQALLLTLEPRESSEGHSPQARIDTLAVAHSFKALAVQLCLATLSSGQTSLRFDAVAKALEFTTPKSALQKFLHADEHDELQNSVKRDGDGTA